MRKTTGKRLPQTPKQLAGEMASQGAYDRAKVRRASDQAVQSADRLLKDMADVFKRLERKP